MLLKDIYIRFFDFSLRMYNGFVPSRLQTIRSEHLLPSMDVAGFQCYGLKLYIHLSERNKISQKRIGSEVFFIS
jgi:uncharacterized protein YqjF (DUF2071 family)